MDWFGYDKGGRELCHRILLSFFVVKILTIQESIARLDFQMVKSKSRKAEKQEKNSITRKERAAYPKSKKGPSYF